MTQTEELKGIPNSQESKTTIPSEQVVQFQVIQGIPRLFRRVGGFGVEASAKTHVKITQPKGASLFTTTVNICKTGLGTGILLMPSVFKECGWVPPLLLNIVVAIICFYCWNILGVSLRTIEKEQKEKGIQFNCSKLTLDEAMLIKIGYPAKLITQIVNNINIIASSIGYVSYISKALGAVIPSLIWKGLLIFSIYFIMAFIRKIESFSKFSKIGLSIYVILIILIVGNSIYTMMSETYELDIVPFRFENIPLKIGIFITAFDINGTVSPIHAAMEKKEKFYIPLMIYILFSGIFSSAIGMIAYTAFQGQTSESIFENLNQAYYVASIMEVTYSLSLVINICLLGFVLVRSFEPLLNISKEKFNFSNNQERIQMIVFKLVYCVLIIYIGLNMNNISGIFNLIGCLFGVILTVVLPCVLYQKVHSTIPPLRSVVNYSLIILSSLCGIYGAAMTFYKGENSS